MKVSKVLKKVCIPQMIFYKPSHFSKLKSANPPKKISSPIEKHKSVQGKWYPPKIAFWS